MSHPAEKRRICVSSISLVHFLLWAPFGAFVARFFVGADGLQLAPTRGFPIWFLDWTVRTVHRLCPVFFAEDVWNNDPAAWGTLDRQVFEDPEKAKLRLAAISKLRPEPTRIVHGLELSSNYVELHVGLGHYDQVARSGCRWVLDTYHLRRRHFFPHQAKALPAEEHDAILRSWPCPEAIIVENGSNVRVVHFQPDRENPHELEQWLTEDPDNPFSDLGQYMQTIKKYCPRVQAYVVELAPPEGKLIKKLSWAFWLPLTMRRVVKKLRATV